MFKKILALMCLGNTASATIVKIDIQDAINKRVISADFSCLGYAIGESIIGNFENLSDDTVSINCPIGLFLDCLDPDKANVYLTSGASFTLAKKDKIERRFMCLAGDRSSLPNTTSSFIITKAKHDAAPRLCELIDSLSLNCYTGQSSLYALHEYSEVSKIIGAFIEKVNVLRLYVAQQNSKIFIDFASEYDLMLNPVFRPMAANSTISLGINGSYFINDLEEGEKITLEVFNDKGKKMYDLPFEVLLYGSKGMMLSKINFSSVEANSIYFVRVMRNKKLDREWLVQVT
jgi:hypothetical protein